MYQLPTTNKLDIFLSAFIMSNNMNKLNNIFPDNESVNQVINYLKTKQIPDGVPSIKRFKDKYKHFELGKDGTLIYKPLGLIVVKPSDIHHTLDKLYKEDPNAFGKGIVSLYKYIASKYINITREDVEHFLKGQTNYQLTRSISKRINKPIVADYPNQLWCIDLIDMNNYIGNNHQFRYIIDVVDAFSRKVWLEKLRVKGAAQVAREFAKICDRAGIYPSYLLSDNGGEFKDEMTQFCKEHNIKQRFTRTYSPEANGIAERTNQDIRKLIRAYMVKNNTKNWTTVLEDVETNKNTTYNSSIKASPNEVWSANKDPVNPHNLPPFLTKDNKKVVAKQHALTRAMYQIQKFEKEDDYKVGDYVRLKMSSIFSNIRKLIKSNESKQIVVSYSPNVYQITKVITPRNGLLERKRYVLQKPDGNVVRTAKGAQKSFYASELQHAEEHDGAHLTIQDALKLNKVEANRNDLQY